MAVERKLPVEIIDKPMNFCPGCGHGIVMRLISECLVELGQEKNVILAIGVGCSGNIGAALQIDRVHCLHGRAGAVATGLKRVYPDVTVWTYQGDGDAYCIGIAESLNAAYRNENISVFVVNNTIYGMTGGQMSCTTMPAQKTSTSPLGRDCRTTGYPMKFPEIIATHFDVAYVARGTVTTAANVNKLKGYIKSALEAQLKGEGYSLVEILSPCPTNWELTPLDAMKRIEKELIPYYPLGELKQRRDIK